MNIELSKHSIERAKERFNWNRKTLRRMLAKAVRLGKKVDNRDNAMNYIYANYHFVVIQNENNLVLSTVINLDTKGTYKDSLRVPLYLRGKECGSQVKRMRV